MEGTGGRLMRLVLMMMTTTTAVPRAMAGEDWLQCPPCKCKWASGKKTAECVRLNYTQIPSELSSEIQILDLTGNRITYVNRDAFSLVKLDNLHKLVLRECGIKAVHADAFNGLKIVIEIDLSGNDIKTLLPGTFVGTQRLRVLLLNQNDLETLENGLFHDLEYLQKVVLSDNRLERIGEKTFRNLPGLQTLDLDGNNLTSLRLSTFENLPKLGSLELRNNPWNCNCHLKRFRDWTIERKLYTQPTTCAQPATLAGKMWDELSSDDFACRPKIIAIGPYPRFETGRGDARLWCRASGTPKPQLSWVYRARIINNSTRRQNNADRGYVINEKNDWLNLTIPDVTISDKGDYICMAKSPGGSIEKNVSLSIIGGEAPSGTTTTLSLPLAIGLGLTFFILVLVTIVLCLWYCRKQTPRNDAKSAQAASHEHRGLGEQEKSLITAINPVVKPPRRYEAPSVTSRATEMTELNRTLLDNDSVFADGPGSVVGAGVAGFGGVCGTIEADNERRVTAEFDNGTLSRGTSYRQYPPDLLAFSGGRGSSPTSQASTAPDNSRLSNHQQQQQQQQSNFGSPSGQYPAGFKTLPHNRAGSASSGHYNGGAVPVLPRHGYVTIPRRPRAPSWSSGPPTSPTSIRTSEALEPVYDNLGRRTTVDGSSVLSLNKSPEPGATPIIRGPGNSHYNAIQRSTPNILAGSPLDGSASEGAPEWPIDPTDQKDDHRINENGTLGRKVPPVPPPKPKKRSPNNPLYEDEGEDGTEV